MTSREAFEEWYVETFKHGEHLEKALLATTENEYIVLSTHHIWMAWQAAERELAAAQTALAAETVRANAMATVAERMERERDEARRDAERYRWLRNCVRDAGTGDIDDRLYVACDDHVYKGKWALDGEELDAAIDAAMGGV